ncbi:demethoxyubiquinone hydroxylase family protein [Paraburkholderia megapolitana]|uniref:demethoxyubiquinone hydroxylase family protein n=1 Tax=Paraburkholderia megapolitana TaxID=420953 RepID=UPI000B882A02|nr:demethoxyubiquinone hydroxylase family protein [Paraburkholderia megapolitana]QDQ80979.1 demethoxyubiquinone hydroxylase family protein [Paraburkholderia megapolitana]
MPIGDRFLRVNHAGENGAVHIYTGQILLARLTARKLVPELIEFRLHERNHRAIFAEALRARGARRCRSYLLCGAGGFALGVVTGLLGPRAISATTAAVERVVLDHLMDQIAELAGKDATAIAAISSIVDDESRHHDASAARAVTGGLWERWLTPIVAASTSAVIWMGMRL